MENQCIYGCAHGVIGLDFGSTYSAAAVLLPSVDGYSTRNMVFFRKFPTSLHVIHGENDVELQFDPVDRVMLRKDRLCHLKALLMNQTNPRNGDNRMVNSFYSSWSGLDLPDEDVVVAKFLKGLFEKALGVARGLDAWHDRLRPAITITYPISWSPEELSMFRSAVRSAGIADHACRTCRVRYITEHRAVVTTMQHEHHNVLAELNSDSMIVADFGGMTDDAAVVPYPDSIPLRYPEEEELELLDRRMLHNSSYTGSMSADAEFRALLLQKGTLKQIFDKSAEAKASLIEALFQQAASLQHNVKCIVLTGGFSLNLRLEAQVKKKLRERLQGDCPVFLETFDRRLAVCTGAVLWRLPHLLRRLIDSQDA
uniref:Uncharacterized protein n=1 Tax=Bionectria ochroleuca TaxID=29856 RepID=A0A8H7TPZ6_BIOOC